MPRTIDYSVTLCEATEKASGIIEIRFSVGVRAPTTTVPASTFAELEAGIQAFVDQQAWGFSWVGVDLPRKTRKPAGFDAWQREHRYFTRREFEEVKE